MKSQIWDFKLWSPKFGNFGTLTKFGTLRFWDFKTIFDFKPKFVFFIKYMRSDELWGWPDARKVIRRPSEVNKRTNIEVDQTNIGWTRESKGYCAHLCVCVFVTKLRKKYLRNTWSTLYTLRKFFSALSSVLWSMQFWLGLYSSSHHGTSNKISDCPWSALAKPCA